MARKGRWVDLKVWYIFSFVPQRQRGGRCSVVRNVPCKGLRGLGAAYARASSQAQATQGRASQALAPRTTAAGRPRSARGTVCAQVHARRARARARVYKRYMGLLHGSRGRATPTIAISRAGGSRVEGRCVGGAGEALGRLGHSGVPTRRVGPSGTRRAVGARVARRAHWRGHDWAHFNGCGGRGFVIKARALHNTARSPGRAAPHSPVQKALDTAPSKAVLVPLSQGMQAALASPPGE